jgi:glutathione S-transferase
MSEFVLHGSPHSLYTYKVALMLRLCRIAFTFRYVSFQRGMHLTSEFRALARWGQVPVLEHRGRALTQSAAILEYLSETTRNFAAVDAATRQDVREWLCWNADILSPPLFNWYGVELGRRGLLPLSFDTGVVTDFQRRGQRALDVLDEKLGGRRFLVGSTPTIADICCYGEIAFARLSDRDLSQWANVTGWSARVEALPGFALPFDLLAMQDAEIAP